MVHDVLSRLYCLLVYTIIPVQTLLPQFAGVRQLTSAYDFAVTDTTDCDECRSDYPWHIVALRGSIVQ